MKEFGQSIGLRITKLINIALITLPFALCWLGYYNNTDITKPSNYTDALIIGLFMILYIIFARIYDAFLISQNRIFEMISSQLLAFLISDGIMFAVIWLVSYKFPNPLYLLVGFVVQIVLSSIWSIIAHKGYYAIYPPKKSLVVYDGEGAPNELYSAYGIKKKFDIEKSISIDECLDNISTLNDYEVVFICGVHSHDRNTLIKHCVSNKIFAYVMPRIGDIIMSGAEETHMFHLPLYKVRRHYATPEYSILKRLFDIVSASLVLIVASPVMLITAIAIKATDGGPVFYKQCRLTADGKKFNILKFRSMRVDAEKDGVARLSSGDKDDRITPVGRVIRKFRIDELPQLLNIIGGSMSVVGPRPERPEIAEQYEEVLPEFNLRLQVKAGLTGYAQVYGKYNTSPYDKLQMDLIYIAKASFVEDLHIIFATIKILFSSESTDGVESGQVTAMNSRENEFVENGSAEKREEVKM